MGSACKKMVIHERDPRKDPDLHTPYLLHCAVPYLNEYGSV
jgi:hypothetical protein